jgi:hypothetical protein
MHLKKVARCIHYVTHNHPNPGACLGASPRGSLVGRRCACHVDQSECFCHRCAGCSSGRSGCNSGAAGMDKLHGGCLCWCSTCVHGSEAWLECLLFCHDRGRCYCLCASATNGQPEVVHPVFGLSASTTRDRCCCTLLRFDVRAPEFGKHA